MDTDDPCADLVGWSVLGSAVPDLTLAGVLAGFLIAVVAALVVQWYDRASPRMIALFASGVPPLTLSSYLFTISSGAKPPKKLTEPHALQGYCNTVWSQWVPAFTMLLIGGSVLLCGLGWALVIYSSHLADRLNEKNFPTRMIEDNSRFFIGLNAWLSLAGTTAMTGLLIAANVLYLKAYTDPNTNDSIANLTLFEFPHGVKWYAMFFVLLFGAYVMVRCAYLVTWRATSFAGRERVPGLHTKSSARRGAWDDKRVRCVAKEIGAAVAIALGAQLASYLTTGILGDNFSVDTTCVMVVVVAYIIGRLAYGLIVHVVRQYSRSTGGGQATTKGYAETAPKIHIAPSVEKPEDAFQYSTGRLITTSYNVVFFAILGTAFSAALTQANFWTSSWQTGVALFIGGFYPAIILLGLSYSVPAAEGIRLPKWKTWPGLRLLP
jgi:hypothetical protein